MWNLSKEHGIKPWEFQNAYDERGNPIMYQEDILMFRYLDSLEAQYQWRVTQGADKSKGSIADAASGDSPFKTTVAGAPQADRKA